MDIDECQEPNICGDNSICNNLNGSYDCKCINGYEMNQEDEECIDIDECKNGDNGCSANSDCRNNDGSYTCTCVNGYFGNGFKCTDRNECFINGDCDTNAVCKSYPGGNSYECESGFEGDGFDCIDINWV